MPELIKKNYTTEEIEQIRNLVLEEIGVIKKEVSKKEPPMSEIKVKGDEIRDSLGVGGILHKKNDGLEVRALKILIVILWVLILFLVYLLWKAVLL